MKIYRVSGKDVFGCRKQLKADGFTFNGDTKSWFGTDENKQAFESRGFRVKVYFNEQVDNDCVREIVGK